MKIIREGFSSAWTEEGKRASALRVDVAHSGSRRGLPDKHRWYTCPGSPCCSEFHPVPWVPAPLPSSVPVRDTWAHRGQRDRYIAGAIHSNAPDTGRHCRRSTAGLWSPLRQEGSPGSREERPRAHHPGAEPTGSWTRSQVSGDQTESIAAEFYWELRDDGDKIYSHRSSTQVFSPKYLEPIIFECQILLYFNHLGYKFPNALHSCLLFETRGT